MRLLLKLLVIPALLLAIVWAGGETLLARQLRLFLDDRPEVTAAAVTGLRDPARFGLGFDGLVIGTQGDGLLLPHAEVSTKVLRPDEFSLALPETGVVRLAGKPFEFGLTQPVADLRVAPLKDMVIDDVKVAADRITLEGETLAQPFGLAAKLVSLGADAPRDARVAYEVTVGVERLDAGLFPDLGHLLPLGTVAMQGQATVWLDALTTPGALSSGPAPQVSGFRTQEIRLSLGQMQVSLIADIRADERGRFQGELALYSRDTAPLLDEALQAGLITEAQKTFTLGMLSQLSQNTTDKPGDSTPFRPADENELRLPVSFADGRTHLGSVEIGPAPLLKLR